MASPTQQQALFLRSEQGEFAVGPHIISSPGAGEIRVKNEAVALNPVDWKIQTYGFFAETYPAILGFDAAGTVDTVGEGITAFKQGDRILYEGALDNAHATFQQYTLINAGLAAKLPENLTFDQGASLPLAITTAAVGLYHQEDGPKFTPPWAEGGKGKYTDTPIVIIGGSGAVGSLAIQFARLSGFAPIITTASLKHVEHLRSYGATHVVDRHLSASALHSEVLKITGGAPVGTVYDAVSVPDTQRAAFGLLAPGGKLLILLPPEVKPDSEGRTVVEVHGIIQFRMNQAFGKELYEEIPALLESGDIKPLHVEVVPGGLEGITTGLAKLKYNRVSATKLVVHPHESE